MHVRTCPSPSTMTRRSSNQRSLRGHQGACCLCWMASRHAVGHTSWCKWAMNMRFTPFVTGCNNGRGPDLIRWNRWFPSGTLQCGRWPWLCERARPSAKPPRWFNKILNPSMRPWWKSLLLNHLRSSPLWNQTLSPRATLDRPREANKAKDLVPTDPNPMANPDPMTPLLQLVAWMATSEWQIGTARGGGCHIFALRTRPVARSLL